MFSKSNVGGGARIQQPLAQSFAGILVKFFAPENPKLSDKIQIFPPHAVSQPCLNMTQGPLFSCHTSVCSGSRGKVVSQEHRFGS